MSDQPRQRLRLRYRKDEVLMYISHRDLLRFLLKLLRQVDLPFATSGKFSPKPKVTFAPALPLGVKADNELVDIELADGVVLDQPAITALARQLVLAADQRDFLAGLTLLPVGQLSLGKQIAAARYELRFSDVSRLADVAQLLDQPALPHPDKTGAMKDLKLAILDHSIKDQTLTVAGAIHAGTNLNVTQLAAFILQQTGQRADLLTRRCFLDNTNSEL